MISLHAPTRPEIETATSELVATTAQAVPSFGTLRASRRVAVSAACRQFAECMVHQGSADERAFTVLQAAIADLVELEIKIARKNRERYNPRGE
jgi:hypothetical protein